MATKLQSQRFYCLQNCKEDFMVIPELISTLLTISSNQAKGITQSRHEFAKLMQTFLNPSLRLQRSLLEEIKQRKTAPVQNNYVIIYLSFLEKCFFSSEFFLIQKMNELGKQFNFVNL